ncbi:MAG: hypothetical protein M5U34_04820 [Chloroflexi bacterium]|nr:hypothetical protein [Chloroflexota bacterium]
MQQAEADNIPLRLFQLATLLGLDRLALDTFLIGMAPQLDPRYGKVYGFLQDDLTRKRPSLNLVLDLLFIHSPERLLALSFFQPDAPCSTIGW